MQPVPYVGRPGRAGGGVPGTAASTLAYPSCVHSPQTRAAKGDALGAHLLWDPYTHTYWRSSGVVGCSCVRPRSGCVHYPDLHPSVLAAPARLHHTVWSLEATWDGCRVGRWAGPTGSTELPGSTRPWPRGLPGHKLDAGCGVRGDPGDRPSGAGRVRGSPPARYI